MDLKKLPPQLFYVAAFAFWVTAFLTFSSGGSQSEGSIWLILGVVMFLCANDPTKKKKK